MKKYWKESLEDLLPEHGIKVTPELIDDILAIREMESEACGFIYIQNPLHDENVQLKKELEKERRKVVCPVCKGCGSITDNFGPAGRSSTSQCYKCNGTGKV